MKRKRITTGRKKFTSGRAVKIARKDPALSRINEHAAGIDIGAQSHFVAVSPASSATPVREFGVINVAILPQRRARSHSGEPLD